MRVSVVIPAYNEEKLLPATLAAVRTAAAAFARRGWDWELVVCDNNSADRTAAVARAAGARVAFEPVNQIGRARDTGARAAMGDWIVFVDADSQPTEALFADIAAALASGRFVGGGATVRLPADSPLVVRFFAGAWNLWSRLARWAAGSCIWVEASAFRAVGGFGTEVYAGEEVWLSRRLGRLARAHHHEAIDGVEIDRGRRRRRGAHEPAVGHGQPPGHERRRGDRGDCGRANRRRVGPQP